MNTERIFEGLGVDAITGVSIMELLGLSVDELQIPQRFYRLQHVVDFLKQFPDDTQRFLISKATRGKMVDKLDHVFEYTHLLQSKNVVENFLENVKKEKSAVELSGDAFKIEQVNFKQAEVEGKLNRLKEEIAIYEK